MTMSRFALTFPFLFALLLAVGLSGLAPGVRAQDGATPVGEAPFPISADPADCEVERRPTDEVIALWLESPPTGMAQASPEGVPTISELTIPVGTPADAATVAAVTDTVRTVFGCFAAGDFPRALALFSDDLIREFGPGIGESEQDLRDFLEATPGPVAEIEARGDPPQIIAITDVMELEDGRVGAFVVTTEDGTLSTVYAIFQRDGNRLLLDEIVEFSGGGQDDE